MTIDEGEGEGEFTIYFDRPEPYVFGGPSNGPDETWTTGRVEIDTDPYTDMSIISDEQFGDLLVRLKCITKFIDDLTAVKSDIEDEINRRRDQERLPPPER